MSRLLFVSASIVFASLAGCSKSPVPEARAVASTRGTKSAEDFLKWSMDQYRATTHYRAEATVVTSHGTPNKSTAKRVFEYSAPNQFKIVSTTGPVVFTCVCDGKSLIDYSNNAAAPAERHDAPYAIGDASSSLLSRPFLCGSLLYQFFGGSGNISTLVNTDDGPISFGKDEKAPNGEPCKSIQFYGQAKYGHVSALIGSKTGFVYRLEYDNEPVERELQASPEAVHEMRESLTRELDHMKAGPDKEALAKNLATGNLFHLDTVENYSNISLAPIAASNEFNVSTPQGEIVRNADLRPGESPIPIGHAAPNFTVTSLNGKKVQLSSLKGHVVVLDFWATWCGPCRKGLPETVKLAKESAAKGLNVIAISQESKSTVASFVKSAAKGLPAYIDADGKASLKYQADNLPTTVVIDRRGNVAAYLVGLRSPSELESAIQAAGL